MKINPSPEFKAKIIEDIQLREFSKREGIHCSDLIYCLNKQVLRRLMPLPPDEHTILLYSLGWSTQHELTGKFGDEPTITKDGIQVTKDALFDSKPWECKASFKSSERGIEDEDSWLSQIMAQCYVSGTTEAYLTRMELAGNWKSIFGKKEEKSLPENQKPSLSAWKLEFTQEELDDNWVWLQRRATLFGGLLGQTDLTKIQLLPKPNALPANHDWECTFCSKEYKALCEGCK